MQRLSQRPFLGYFSLAVFWLMVNALPLLWLTDGRFIHAEILQARKLLDYGFWVRKGALLTPPWYVGMLRNPAEYNYVNHNYPINWLFTFLYWLFGEVGVYAFAAAASLAGSLMTYWILKRLFAPSVAWWTAVLMVTAHASVEFTTNPDMLAQGAIIWPAAVMILVRLRQADAQRNSLTGWLLGLVVFLGGQINWFALTTVPAMMLLCVPEQMPLNVALRRPWVVPGVVPLLTGAMASLALFVGQILVYSPSLHGNAEYLGMQMGVDSFIGSRLNKLPVLLLRMLLAGPAVWFGALVALTQFRQRHPARLMVTAMLSYLFVFTLVMLAIPRLLFLNQHGFRYPIFPCAILTGFALTWLGAKWFRTALSVIALVGLLSCYAKLHDYRVSMASWELGKWVAAQTAKDEVIFSNFKYLTPPIQPWNGEFCAEIGWVADRLVFCAVTDESELTHTAERLTQGFRQVSFLRAASQPMDLSLLHELKSEATERITANLPVPPDNPRYFKMARAILWRLLGRNAPQHSLDFSSPTSETNTFNLTLYRLTPEAVQRIRAGFNPDLNTSKPGR